MMLKLESIRTFFANVYKIKFYKFSVPNTVKYCAIIGKYMLQ